MPSLPLTQLSIAADHAPGCDSVHIVRLVSGELVDDRPVEVRYLCTCGRYEIVNGRHRFLAALIRGDDSIACELVE